MNSIRRSSCVSPWGSSSPARQQRPTRQTHQSEEENRSRILGNKEAIESECFFLSLALGTGLLSPYLAWGAKKNILSSWLVLIGKGSEADRSIRGMLLFLSTINGPEEYRWNPKPWGIKISFCDPICLLPGDFWLMAVPTCCDFYSVCPPIRLSEQNDAPQ